MMKTWLLSGCALVVLTALLIAPSPYMAYEGGVTFYGRMEEYGPEIPENIVGGYIKPTIQSVVLPAKDENAGEGKIYVYATKEQKNYHMSTCKFAYASGQELTLYEAYHMGYTPGKCCDAPPYTGL